MDYVMINQGKLKIMLEAQDLEHWDIRVDELDYSNPYAKAIFEEILAYAKDNLGFDSEGKKVLLQLYPSRDGGCELFITRLGELCEADEEGDALSIRAYSFEQLSHLLSVCRLLCLRGFSGKSSAWFDNDGKWFLLLYARESEDEASLGLDTLSFICEYGESEIAGFLSLYLQEHASSVCEENAAAILGKI